MNKLHFSFSTLNNLMKCSHSWINKTMGIKVPHRDYFDKGKEGHRVIQDHVSGRKKDERIAWLTEEFPIVEKRDFDPDCKFDISIGGYSIIGFLDLQDPAKKRYGEIKLSGVPWSLGKYKDSIQRKIYSLAFPQYKTGMLITGPFDPNQWKQREVEGEKMSDLKVMEWPLTEQDRKEATEWIKKGLAIFEAGDFNGGLDPDTGRCIDRGCPYMENCHFKNL